VIQQHPWLLKAARKILSHFSTKEGKTPLSFFAQLRTAIVTLAILGVFLVQPKERLELLIGAGTLLFLLAVIVALITWFRPQNLVFGESVYRAIPTKQAIPTPSALDSRNRPAA
jgi:hypothetical protein